MNIICSLFGHKVISEWPFIWSIQVRTGDLLNWKTLCECRDCGKIFQWPDAIPMGTEKYPMGCARRIFEDYLTIVF